MVNKAQYLINQKKYEAAERELVRAEAADPDSARVREMRALLSVRTGRYNAALEFLETHPLKPAGLFLQAAALYQLNRERDSSRLFAQLRKTSDKRNGQSYRQIAELAGAAFCTTCSVREFEYPITDDPVMEMLSASFQARILFSNGTLEESGRQAQRALALGDQNVNSAELAAICAVIFGNFSAAQQYADTSSSSTVFYHQISGRLETEADYISSVSITLTDAGERFHESKRMEHALLWFRLRRAQNEKEMENQLYLSTAIHEQLNEEPANPMLRLMFAESLETLGDRRGAYEQYHELQKVQPSYSASLRLAALADVPDPNQHRIKADIVAGGGVVSWGDADSMECPTAKRVLDHWRFQSAGKGSMKVDIPASGDYDFTLVAKADCAFSLCPVVTFRIDGELIGSLYICREDWDCFGLSHMLSVGQHTIEFEYGNNSERLLSQDEDRNLYVRELIVSASGVK